MDDGLEEDLKYIGRRGQRPLDIARKKKEEMINELIKEIEVNCTDNKKLFERVEKIQCRNKNFMAGIESECTLEIFIKTTE